MKNRLCSKKGKKLYTQGTVQLNSKLTLECVSLASTRKVSNVTREVVASARMSLAN